MREFIQRVFNTEFLPVSEVRKIKVVLVMLFLLLNTAITIPFSFFLNYDILVKIAIVAGLILFFVGLVFLVQLNKVMLAIHFTIIYSLLLTMYYSFGSASLYAYLFFYISLVIIIFYQELYIYIFYGSLVVILGGFYTFFNQDGLVLVNDIPGSVYLYVIFLVIFYIIFFIQILVNEKFYMDLNYRWVRMNHIIDKYQSDILYYLDKIQKETKNSVFYEDLDFQKAADELSVFIYDQFKANGREITNVLDLYIYIHERGLDKILENDEFSTSTKKIANKLTKYMLDEQSEMISMIINFHTLFRKSEKYQDSRYMYDISSLTGETDEQIIAFGLFYYYLSHEIYGLDEWDEMTKVLTKEEIDALFEHPEIEQFLSPKQIGFYKDNVDLFTEYLSKKKE